MESILAFALTNISTVISQEIKLLGGLRIELQMIKDELQLMMVFLKTADSLLGDHPDVGIWVELVRDVANDIEDILDDFMSHHAYRNSRGLCARARKVKIRFMGPIVQHQLANKIQDIKKRIKNISDAHASYKTEFGTQEIGPSNMHTTNRWTDKLDHASFVKEADLVGIEKPKREVTEMLLSDDTRRCVISVLGMGGLGKTTLVKKIYDDEQVKSNFSHHAWIRVSQSSKMKDQFNQAIRQLFRIDNQQLPQDLDGMDINGLTQEIHKFLQSKKYLVVFDDVWTLTDWNAIHTAFPTNREGSRVVITTRNVDIRQTVISHTEEELFIYSLNKLPDKEARKLFCRKAFKDATCPKHLEEICQKILKSCDGLPLAIEVLGSLLASKSPRTEEWDNFYRNSREVLEANGITKLLSLSYYDLPYDLRICLLYLSSFPDHAHIEKMTLIRLWIAEGFVQQRRDMTIEEVAESYLNELISRCLLQVVELRYDGKIKAIAIHDVIRQIILDKSMEQNMTSILREHDQIMEFKGKVRRLAIHGFNISNIEVPENKLKSLRSLVVFEFSGDSTKQKPFLSSILRSSERLLKVLDLRGASLTEIPDEVFNLIRLTYLSLRNTKVSIIPKSIRKLQSLETLDLKGTNVQRLPVQILDLQQLRHLLVYKYQIISSSLFDNNIESCKIPYKISSLKSLQKLSYIEAEQVGVVKIVDEIGKLTQLRRLGITKLRKEDGIPLCSSLEKLTKLRSLVIVSKGEDEIIDLQYSFSSSALTFLQFLHLKGRLEKFPQWIASLYGLTNVALEWSGLRVEDPLKFLQDLPNLVELVLNRAYEGERLNFKAGGFLKLKMLTLGSLQLLMSVMVEEGAMPSLEKLTISKCESMKEIPIGTDHLVSLKDLWFVDMSYAFLKHLESLEDMSDVMLTMRSMPVSLNALSKHLESLEDVSDESTEALRYKVRRSNAHVPRIVNVRRSIAHVPRIVALSNGVDGVKITHHFSFGIRIKH